MVLLNHAQQYIIILSTDYINVFFLSAEMLHHFECSCNDLWWIEVSNVSTVTLPSLFMLYGGYKLFLQYFTQFSSPFKNNEGVMNGYCYLLLLADRGLIRLLKIINIFRLGYSVPIWTYEWVALAELTLQCKQWIHFLVYMELDEQ